MTAVRSKVVNRAGKGRRLWCSPGWWSRMTGICMLLETGEQHGTQGLPTRVPQSVLDLIDAGRKIADLHATSA
jgi:hypothetical protein